MSRLFAMSASALEVTTDQGPEAFHQLLRRLIRGARRRISLASLYVGTGALERELLAELRHALERSPELEVQLVLDYSRARRRTAEGTSVSFLAELVRDHPGRVGVFLHRMPQLDGWASWLPSPLDEVVTVFHFKALVFDDAAILTGANLSDEYFRCRQARYVVVRDLAFTGLLHRVVSTTARHSLPLRCVPRRAASGALELGQAERAPLELSRALLDCVETAERSRDDHDTYLAPLFQHPRVRLRQEHELLRQLLATPDGDLVVSTPYPNFPLDYADALATRVRARRAGRTLMLGPSGESHSFSTGVGLKALVPGAYLERERALARRLRRASAGPASPHVVQLRHYDRPGWVLHAKGVWLTRDEETATVIGSSSFGERSLTRDLDMSCLLVTKNAGLRRALAREVECVLTHARPHVRSTRRGAWVSRLVMPMVRRFL